jgi:hypothetical protein
MRDIEREDPLSIVRTSLGGKRSSSSADTKSGHDRSREGGKLNRKEKKQKHVSILLGFTIAWTIAFLCLITTRSHCVRYTASILIHHLPKALNSFEQRELLESVRKGKEPMLC